MEDRELAKEIIKRLNSLVEDEAVRKLFENAIENRTFVSSSVIEHPTIQAWKVGDEYAVGFLGILNGIIGAISGGRFDRWGYISAKFTDVGELVKFELTDGND